MHRWQLKMGWALALAPARRRSTRRRGRRSRTGNIYGKVVDESRAVLPGATATLTGQFGTRTTTADNQGEFRFLNVDHGTHSWWSRCLASPASAVTWW